MLLSSFVASFAAAVCSIYHHSQCSTTTDSLPLLLDATLDELRAGLDNGQFTSVDLVRAYISRIQQVNDKLHAVTEINPDALAIAADLDRLARDGQKNSTSPLYGIPILLKDDIATADKLNTTAGSFALLGATVHKDSTVAAKLREAGAIILGKTNLSQWSGLRSSNSSHGWSAYGGQTQGAYFPNMDPEGSSSGSAVAASIGLAWAALGTDGGSGSMSDPAHKNNLVGIRPTVGLTSRHLVVSVSELQGSVGPLARTVKDAAYLLQAITGADSNDKYTSASPFGYQVPNFVAACKETGLRGKRIGIPKDMRQWWFDKTTVSVHTALDEAIEIMRAAGAEVIEDIELPGVRTLMKNNNKWSNEVAAGEMATSLSKYFAQLKTNPNNIKSLADMREFTQKHTQEEYPHYNTKMWDLALEQQQKRDSQSGDASWKEAVANQRYYSGPLGLTGALRNHSLDALVMPTVFASKLATPIGCPVISVPFGKSPEWTPTIRNEAGNLHSTAANQPFGIAFTGDMWREELLIGMAYAFEQKTMARKEVHPYLQPTTELRDIVASTPSDVDNMRVEM